MSVLKDGMVLTELDRGGSKLETTLRVDQELWLFYSILKFFVLDGLSSGVVAVSTDAAPDSAFAPSFFTRPTGQLP